MPRAGSQSQTSKPTKAELKERMEVLGQLLFEAVHLLSTEEDYGDEERNELIQDFLERCRQAGFV